MSPSMPARLIRDVSGAANPRLVALIGAVTLPIAGGYALGYDVGGEALYTFNAAISGVMRLIGV